MDGGAEVFDGAAHGIDGWNYELDNEGCVGREGTQVSGDGWR